MSKRINRKELVKMAAIYKVEICKQNGGNTNFETWYHYMSKQSGAELKRIIENIKNHLEREVVIA